MKECTFEGYTLDRVYAEREHMAALYKEWGVLYFPRLLQNEPVFQTYLQDVHALMCVQADKAGLDPSVKKLGLTELAQTLVKQDPKWLMPIYDIGTRPVKLLTGNLLKFDPRFQEISRAILGEKAIMATPCLSDTLLVHLPGEAFRKFDIPLHQDFHYLMQSAEQITYWCNLTAAASGVGGMKVYPGSHKLGVCRAFKDTASQRYVLQIDHPKGIAAYPEMDVIGDEGTLVIQDALLLHASVPNASESAVRVTQLFRYTNIATKESAAYDWQSTVHASRGVTFAEAYPDHILEPVTAKNRA